MINSVKCPNCNTENPFYNSNCSQCRNYLRDKVYNLDLWSIISLIIESPSQAFKKIIYSEHKNFILFIVLLVSIKHLINTRFISMFSLGSFKTSIELYFSYLILLVVIIIFFLIISFLFVRVGASLNSSLRYKDTLSLIIYSQIPYLFGLVILFTLELIIFGDYLFSINPSPFVIKSTLAYLFAGLELALIIWSGFLLTKAFIVQTHQKLFSILSVIVFFVLFFSMIYLISFFIFTI